MSVSELAEQYLREHAARMREIDRRGLDVTYGLAVFNARSVFLLSNARVHPDAQLPTEAINELTSLIQGEGDASGLA